MPEREIKRTPKAEVEKREQHPLYQTWCDAKSVAVEVARQIIRESSEPPANVQKFLVNLGEKTV